MIDGKALKNSHAFGCSCLYWPLRGLSGKCFCCGCGRAVVVEYPSRHCARALNSARAVLVPSTVPVLHRAEHLHGIAFFSCVTSMRYYSTVGREDCRSCRPRVTCVEYSTARYIKGEAEQASTPHHYQIIDRSVHSHA